MIRLVMSLACSAFVSCSTQARLDREIIGDTSVYQLYPFQTISIDYIRSEAVIDIRQMGTMKLKL